MGLEAHTLSGGLEDGTLKSSIPKGSVPAATSPQPPMCCLGAADSSPLCLDSRFLFIWSWHREKKEEGGEGEEGVVRRRNGWRGEERKDG